MISEDKKRIVKKEPISFPKAAILSFIFLISYITCIILLDSQPQYDILFSFIIITILYFLVALSLMCASIMSKGSGKRTQIAWALLSISVFVSAIANVLWGLVAIYSNQNPASSLADILYLSFYPIFIIGILAFPSNKTSSKRFKYYFDVLIVLFSSALIFWAFFISPAITTYKGDYYSLIFKLAYVFTGFFLLFILVNLTNRIKDKMRTPFFLLIIGTAIMAITDIIYAYQTIQGTYVPGNASDVGWVISYIALGLAGVSQFSNYEIDFKRLISPYVQNYDKITWTPYVALCGVSAAYILLIWAYNTYNSNILLLELGIGILIFLVVVRQIISIRENRNMYLDAQKEILIRKQISKSLKESENAYRTIFENTGTATVIIEEDNKISLANAEFEKLSCYSQEELDKGKNWTDFVLKSELDSIKNHYNQLGSELDENSFYSNEEYSNYKLNSNSSPKNFECQFVDKEGGIKSIHSIAVKIPGTKKTLVSLLDMTEQRKAEEQLKNSLNEKEMLLKEIHHRVKNNLMVISSLLSLQSRYIKNKEDLELFEKSQSRAKSMALIHERLYQSEDLKRIDFGDYIRKLAVDMFNTYISNPGEIKLEINAENAMIDINTAIPLGLILNELLSNSMKYAFPDGRNGTVTVNFSKKDILFNLTVKDDGIGFPSDVNYKNTDSLGLQLINSLTGQIDGQIILNTSNGTSFTIIFEDEEYRKN